MEELEKWEHQRRLVSTCRQRQHPFCHPSEGGRTYLCAPGPYKGSGKEEPEEELKHLLSQKQTGQLTELAEEVLVEKVQHDEAEQWQIQRLHVQSS